MDIAESFDCGDSDMNEFLMKDALKYIEGKIAVTYLCFCENELIGYYSLSNDSIEIKGRDKRVLQELGKRQKTYPAIKIGRLGIDKRFWRKGIGSRIIEIVIGFGLRNSEHVGCRYISVDAYPQQEVVNFYKKNDFKCLKTKEKRKNIPMYLDLLKKSR